MMGIKKYKLSIIVVVLLLILFNSVACSSEPEPDATVEKSGDTTQTEESSSTPQTEESSSTPQAEESPTPVPVAEAEVLVNVNLRQGPGTNYAVVGGLPEKSKITVIGRNEDGSWLLAETEAGREVWLSGDPELVNMDENLVAGLPVVDAPPPAYDAGNPKVNEVLNLIPLVVHHEASFTCAAHGGINNLLPDVQEGHVIGPHAGDFVWVDQGNVLFKYSNGTLILIRENPIARFEGGAEALPLDKALEMFATGEIVWNGMFGQSPARGVTGCDQTP